MLQDNLTECGLLRRLTPPSVKFLRKRTYMNYKKNKKLLTQAVNEGCKTVSELALYLKIQARIQA